MRRNRRRQRRSAKSVTDEQEVLIFAHELPVVPYAHLCKLQFAVRRRIHEQSPSHVPLSAGPDGKRGTDQVGRRALLPRELAHGVARLTPTSRHPPARCWPMKNLLNGNSTGSSRLQRV